MSQTVAFPALFHKRLAEATKPLGNHEYWPDTDSSAAAEVLPVGLPTVPPSGWTKAPSAEPGWGGQ